MFEKLKKIKEHFLMKLCRKFSKRGMSSTVIGVIILVIGMALILFLLIHFGKQSESQTSTIVDNLNIIRGGGGLQ
jgi:xanthine/uracil permease